MILIPVKAQPDGSNATKIILESSWHIHLNYSNPYLFILQKLKNPLDIFCNHHFFASAIILIYGGLFLHRLSRILKVKFNWISAKKLTLQDKNLESGSRIQIQVSSVGRQERILPKSTPKIYPLFSAQFQQMGYSTYSLQEFNPQNKLDLTLMGHHS